MSSEKTFARRLDAKGRFTTDAAVFSPAKGQTAMNLGWILLALVGWALGLVFTLILLRMASDQDRAARREEKHLFPHSDVTITQFGYDPHVAKTREPQESSRPYAAHTTTQMAWSASDPGSRTRRSADFRPRVSIRRLGDDHHDNWLVVRARGAGTKLRIHRGRIADRVGRTVASGRKPSARWGFHARS